MIKGGLRPKGIRRVGSKLRIIQRKGHLTRQKVGIKAKKIPTGTPKWIKAIPRGVHGSGHLQQRLWRLTSDFVRIRDWHKYGVCIATGEKIRHWTLADAGHYKSYTQCNGLFKFDPLNIHLQSKTSNGWGGQETGFKFGESLKRRYGEKILEDIDTLNKMHEIKPILKEAIIERMKTRLEQIAELPEQPNYFKRTISLLTT